MKKKKRIIRKFEVDPCRGMAAMLVGSKAEGLPLKSMVRKGNKVTAIYGE